MGIMRAYRFLCMLIAGTRLPTLYADLLVRISSEPVEASDGVGSVLLANCIAMLRPASKKRKNAQRQPAGSSSALGRGRDAPDQPLPLFVKIANFSIKWMSPLLKLNKKAVEGSRSLLNDPFKTQSVGDVLLATKKWGGEVCDAVAIVLHMQVTVILVKDRDAFAAIFDHDEAKNYQGKENQKYLVTWHGYAQAPNKDGIGS
ncbi:hypothetical protein COO60DRAFT_1690474, partial [Scenedesmus sp. NREL 46B-D3]